MLASCARVVTRKTANAAAQSPLSGGRTLSSPHSVSSHPKKLVSNSKRFYAGHGHEEEAPKPYKRTTLSPRPADAMNSANDREREVQGIEGWIFGRKVTYIDPLKPIPNTEEQATANGWMWNKKPRAAGEPFVWEDWEPITYIGTAIFVVMCVVGLWSRPEVNIQVWATEEARERKIIKARRELELSREESL